MGHYTRKFKKGFTIIEVMIVLAVAGLIMLIVLVAIPQLQRSQRNSARKDVLGRIKTELESYSANNNGGYPNGDNTSGAANFANPAAAAGFFARYMGCSTALGVTTCTSNINEPRTGTPVGFGTISGDAITTVAGINATPILDNTPGSLAYATTRICSGENMTGTGAGARNFALQIQLEGGAIFCLDNR